MAFLEADIINQVAAQERGIAGVKNSYNFATNPDVLQNAMLPAVIHYSPNFTTELRAHHNAWANTINVTSILCVAPREGQGAKLKFLENDAIPYGQKWRTQFQLNSVITTLLTNTASVKAFLTSGAYGAGGALLTVGGIEYIGWIFSFGFVNS